MWISLHLYSPIIKSSEEILITNLVRCFKEEIFSNIPQLWNSIQIPLQKMNQILIETRHLEDQAKINQTLISLTLIDLIVPHFSNLSEVIINFF